MPILKDSKNYLEFIGKDATLLSVAILILFVENVSHFSHGASLINDKKVDYEQLLHFKFLFGFITFLFACKPLFVLFNVLINYFPLYKLEISISYKVGFGCFVLAILLFFHVWITDESNAFLRALPGNSYKLLTVILGVLSLLFAALCDWSGNDIKADSK